MTMNCIIIDDEPLAREGLSSYVREVDFLQLITTCTNPVELIKLLDEYPVDLIFLVITTAFPSYALEGFQLNVMDYLLKPITFDRFFKAANKAKDYYQLLNRPTAGSPKAEKEEDYFFVKCGSKYEKIFFDDILYVHGMQNYVTIYTKRAKYMTLLCLKNLEENLDRKAFIRVHKSYIVAVSKIEGIEGNEIFIQSNRIPISRNYHDMVIEQVVKNKLWDKIRFS